MKTKIKNRLSLSSLVCIITFCLSMMFTIFTVVDFNAFAANEDAGKDKYYYQEIKRNDLAKRFYNAFDEMSKNDEFKTGQFEYDLSSVLTTEEIQDYVTNGTPKIQVALGAARDAFYMDNPDLFYVDLYKVYFTAGMQNNSYVAYLNTGRADNYYRSESISNKEQVESAIEAYETAINNIVTAAKNAGDDAVTQIKFVNKTLATQTSYGYGDNQLVYTAYGALVNKEAVCEGYTRAFKVIMDRLEIECVIINGLSNNSASDGLEGHSWNAVNIEGLWYGVDVTWNSTTGKTEKYLLVGDEFLSTNHFADGVVSSSGFELKYPALRPYGYGVEAEKDGFVLKDSGTVTQISGTESKFGYSSDSLNAENVILTLGVSYDGKNVLDLEKEGKYLAMSNMGEEGVWYPWINLNAVYGDGYNDGYLVTDEYTITYWGSTSRKCRFAIIDYAPDAASNPVLGNIDMYNPENLTEDHIIAVSVAYGNDAFGSYYPAPSVLKKTPDFNGTLQSFDPLDISLKYREQLVFAEGKSEEDLEVIVTSSRDDIKDFIKIENVRWDSTENTLYFRFTPSKQYQHSSLTYSFAPSCLVGEKSGKAPDAANYSFKMKSVVCSKFFGDGRYLMKVFGEPEFVGAEDMSVSNFVDKDGNYLAENERSQMMLVVNKPSASETQQMKDKLLSDADINLESQDIKASATYSIDIQACGRIQQIPNGSYMQVGFGFPENFRPEDGEVTYTVYHYKRDKAGNIIAVEEVPCIVTEYGIIATVNSFSPFMICAVDAAKASQNKFVYASVNGEGGNLDKTRVLSVAEGGEVTYTLTEKTGYDLYKVLLNGEDITSKVSEGKLTLGFAELEKNNQIEVSFISSRVKTKYQENGFEIIEPKIVITENDMFVAGSDDQSAPAGNNNTIVIVVSVLSALVVVGVAAYFVMKYTKGKKEAK